MSPLIRVYVEGYKYFLTIADDFIWYTWICLMKTKAERHTFTKFDQHVWKVVQYSFGSIKKW